MLAQSTIISAIKAAGQFFYGLALSFGGVGLFFLALADSSFLSIPEGNDILIVVLSTGQSWEMMCYYVLATTAGSIVGCTLLFMVGRKGGKFVHRRLSGERLNQFDQLYRRWGAWAILIPSILPPPTPFKIFVLAAGVFRVTYKRFLLAVALGRSIRYFMWGILAVIYGVTVRHFLEENIQSVGIVLFIIFITLFVTLVVFRLRHRSRRQAA